MKDNYHKNGDIFIGLGKVLRQGTGGFHPKANSPCECHYAGYRLRQCVFPRSNERSYLIFLGSLISGKEFDSSYARGQPSTFAPNQVIRGWTEAMQLMVEGDAYLFL